ncbi:MAG: hypothetical protein LUF02_05875, partial [Erysipelotrichaceae bacterium]|nr:hypothetical protein [Erysipelotrichaceae bacterium]
NYEIFINLYLKLQILVIKDKYNSQYQAYISHILDTDIEEFKSECISVASCEDTINVSAYTSSRSTLSSKTVMFYTSRNSMTLTYKYSGSQFDTTYTPTVSVKRLNNTNYFYMTSHTGSFKNSNKTYSVIAKGKIYTTTGVANNKSFTVNFNL